MLRCLLLAAGFVPAVLLAAFGVLPIWRACGRLPHGGGEILSRVLGIWMGC